MSYHKPSSFTDKFRYQIESVMEFGRLPSFDVGDLYHEARRWPHGHDRATSALELLSNEIALNVLAPPQDAVHLSDPVEIAAASTTHIVRLRSDDSVELCNHPEFNPESDLEGTLMLLSLDPESMCPCFRYLPQVVAHHGVPKGPTGKAYVITRWVNQPGHKVWSLSIDTAIRNYLTPVEAVKYNDALTAVEAVRVVGAFTHNKVDRDEFKAWIDAGFRTPVHVNLMSEGFTIEDVAALRDAGITGLGLRGWLHLKDSVTAQQAGWFAARNFTAKAVADAIASWRQSSDTAATAPVEDALRDITSYVTAHGSPNPETMHAWFSTPAENRPNFVWAWTRSIDVARTVEAQAETHNIAPDTMKDMVVKIMQALGVDPARAVNVNTALLAGDITWTDVARVAASRNQTVNSLLGTHHHFRVKNGRKWRTRHIPITVKTAPGATLVALCHAAHNNTLLD